MPIGRPYRRTGGTDERTGLKCLQAVGWLTRAAPVGWLAGWLAAWMAGWLAAGCMAGCWLASRRLARWLAGWPAAGACWSWLELAGAGWSWLELAGAVWISLELAGELVSWPAGWLCRWMAGRVAGWVACWVSDWLPVCLVGLLTARSLVGLLAKHSPTARPREPDQDVPKTMHRLQHYSFNTYTFD